MAALSPQQHSSLAGLIRDDAAELERLRAFSSKVLEWDEHHPKSAIYMSQDQIIAAEMELDEIITTFRQETEI